MRWIVALALLVLVACVPPAAPPSEAPPAATSIRLPRTAKLVEETLDLVVDPRSPTFSGRATIRVELEPTPTIVLHGRELTITRAVVTDARGEIGARVATRRALGGREADEELVLTLPRTASGAATITLDYDAPFAKLRGLYRVHVGDEWFAFTQLEAVDARRMFPGFDEPAFKAPYVIRVEVPAGMSAFGNAPLERTEPTRGGAFVRHVFARTAPLPAYLVALAVGRLETIALPPSAPSAPPVRLIATPGRAEEGRAALAEAADYLRILGEYFGTPYPYAKLDLVAVPDFGPGAMENVGLVTFREELLLTDGASLATRRRRSIVLAHELAHQWFGDLVTMAWWDDLWLNEAFATWMAAKACDTEKPGFGGALDLVGGKLGAMTADALSSARPVRLPVTTSDAIHETGGWSAYQKGAAILAMLERWLGEATFRDGVRRYVAAHANGMVVAADLLGALDAASGKPVTRVATPFLDRTGAPIVRARAACTDAKLDVSFTAEHGGAPSWPIPVCARQRAATSCVLVDDAPVTMQLPSCEPFYGNADEAGYYRFVAEAPFARAASETERMAALPNAWALVQRGALDAGAFFDAVDASALDREPSRVVLEQAIEALGAAHEGMVDDAAVDAFQRNVRRWLGPRAKSLGFAPRAGESEDERLLRAEAQAALWDLGRDPTVAAAVEPIAKAWLADRASADPDLGPLALRISAAAGGAATDATLRALLPRATPRERPPILGALASQRGPAAIEGVLELVVDGTIRPGDFRYVWTAVARTREGRRVAAAFFRDRFEDLRPALGGVGGLAGTIAWACDGDEQTRSATFYAAKLSTFEGMQRAYDEGLAWSRSCIAVRSREAGRARSWLDRHGTVVTAPSPVSIPDRVRSPP